MAAGAAVMEGEFDIPLRAIATGPDGAVWFSPQLQCGERRI
ncbi:hypothetical protein [Streptomyces ochraceiscleroticus]|uniref:Uncharacterized protein n=1 Tax=Streptomyces ochraceiscleroticus TaxID=47761 RepID=A0ABW1MH32_9ACTN|nr:hypothetical protein [Streptomyces ochraceiscleroticus]